MNVHVTVQLVHIISNRLTSSLPSSQEMGSGGNLGCRIFPSGVSCVRRLKVSKSNSGISCACLTCITDNYPVFFNQQAFVHWG